MSNIDGRMAHANGTFEFKLQGLERAQAHAEIMKLTDPWTRVAGRNEASDIAVAEIMRSDPSMLLEPIPDRYPLKRTSPEAWANADAVWSNYSNGHCNWLSWMVDHSTGYLRTISVALEHGIHPDDESVWPGKRLLCTEGWLTNPERLLLALSMGASPTRNTNWDEAYLHRVLAYIRTNVCGNQNQETDAGIFRGIRCADILLEAGTQEIDPPVPPINGPSVISADYKQLTAIGLLLDGGKVPYRPNIQSKLNEFMGRLQSAGADINRKSGVAELPPVIQALRQKNIESACNLILLGCKTSDNDLVRTDWTSGLIAPLMSEARNEGQEPFMARITSAIMQRQLKERCNGNSVESRIVTSTDTAIQTPVRRRIGV